MLRGIGAGFWWSSVTFTTVGYGDTVPVTVAGRLIAVLWMLASVVLVTAFTGFVTARVAIGHLEQIRHGSDLAQFRIGVVRGSAGDEYLDRQHIDARRFAALPDAIRAMTRREVDGVVHPEAMLRYVAGDQFRGAVQVLPDILEREFYAFAVASGSPLREPLNRALLQIMEQPVWRNIEFRYLGSAARAQPGDRRA